MEPLWIRKATELLPRLVNQWLGEPVELLHLDSAAKDQGFDFVLKVPGVTLFAEVKSTDAIPILDRAVNRLAAIAPPAAREASLIVVPFMGAKARIWAQDKGLSWADLSGNADIRVPGLRIVIRGEANQFADLGRPSNPFTAKFSRVTRAFLSDPPRWWKQHALSAEIGLPTGTVSKVVKRLRALDLIEGKDSGEIRSRAPGLLLDAWAQRFNFADHDLHRYHAVGRSGTGILQDLAEKLASSSITWAASGLSAAWMYTRFADFRLNTFLVDSHPADPEALGLRPVDKGENVWLVVPRDEGAFYARTKQGIWCAHPVQVYLDLLGHPERAPDAAKALRTQQMAWGA